ncbi:unnamed protein product [Heligmosomoides polygyrus]|uniref:Mitochondrial import inner membrane translocase subunit n=1 Tax=Heligmosomoides polygyrus TaxID=6339 RepID=A0A3P8AWJ3_HELPZ|nr:unnamed protein product [Heligmosomoides polygyrus]
MSFNKKSYFFAAFCCSRRGMEQLLDMETLKQLTPEKQQQVIQAVKQQAAIANAQNLITDLSEKCTQKCITSPGSSLSSSDKQCLQRCMDRFMDSWNLVSQTLQKRLQEELTSSGAFHGGSSSFS